MVTIVSRASKGSPLDNAELDANFANLNSGKPENNGTGASGTWGISITGNAATATNGVVTTGSYANPAWITSLAETKVLPSQATHTGKFLTTNGTATSWVNVPAPNNGTLTLAVSGTGLSGSATFTADQSGNSTFTVASNATNANTASTIVARDASGNFSAGTITAALSGNATTATTLQTARTIGGVSFNGSANINLPGVNTTGNQNTTGSAATLTTGRTIGMTGDVTWTSASFNGSANVTGTSTLANSGVTAGSYGGNNSIPSITVDAKGRVTAVSTVTPSGTYAISISGSSASTTGNAATATALQTARLIGGVSFNGTANINLPGVNTAGNQNTSGNAATATTATNANNVAIATDTSSTGSFFVPYASATTGNVAMRGTRLTVQPSTGNFTAAGTITANSDERIKTDWSDLPQDFIERLTQVKVGTYTRTDTGARQAGSSAQDWQKLLPEVVTTGEDEQGTLSLAYGNAALVACVKLAQRVLELEQKLAITNQNIAEVRGQ